MYQLNSNFREWSGLLGFGSYDSKKKGLLRRNPWPSLWIPWMTPHMADFSHLSPLSVNLPWLFTNLSLVNSFTLTPLVSLQFLPNAENVNTYSSVIKKVPALQDQRYCWYLQVLEYLDRYRACILNRGEIIIYILQWLRTLQNSALP